MLEAPGDFIILYCLKKINSNGKNRVFSANKRICQEGV